MVVGTLAFRFAVADILCHYGIYERCLSDLEAWPVSEDDANTFIILVILMQWLPNFY